MPLKNPVTAINDQPEKEEKIICDCDFLWSLSHQFSYLRLSDKVAVNEYNFINSYKSRAKRIAATYARFYLEIEEGGDPDKIGRHYWMALGAFASKTVACLLDYVRLWLGHLLGKSTPLDHEDIVNGLGKGNLWLFIDVAGWHWLYNNHPENFAEGMLCQNKRDASTLEVEMQKITDDIPWAADALPRVNNLKLTKDADILEGLMWAKELESQPEKSKKKKANQFNNLEAIAKHEQGAILQELIYNDPDFYYWTQFERSNIFTRMMAPKYELVFSHACETDDPELKSEAPDDLIIEDYISRMDWIMDAADVFHKLMDKKDDYMHQELKTIAGWVNTEDGDLVF